MNILELEKQREELLIKICNFPLFRPGTLTSRYRKCGKKNCHCADENSKGHGPSWTITRKVEGKTVAKYIRVEMLEETKKQIQNYHDFQTTVNKMIETNIKLCDNQLEQNKTAAIECKKKAERRNYSSHRTGSIISY